MTSVGFFTQVVGVLGETDAKVLLGLFVAIPATLAAWSGYQSAMARREARQQMQANGGATIRDALNRLEDGQRHIVERLTLVEDYITNPKES